MQYVKYSNVDFGRCPRVFCQGQPVLPVGQADIARTTTVNIFCPKCQDIFFPKSSRQGSEKTFSMSSSFLLLTCILSCVRHRHWWGIFWHNFSSFVFDDAYGAHSSKTSNSIHTALLWIQDSEGKCLLWAWYKSQPPAQKNEQKKPTMKGSCDKHTFNRIVIVCIEAQLNISNCC
jgi:hypothetical protein